MVTLKELLEMVNSTSSEINGRWVPARPINFRYQSFIEKLRDAWAVFTGKADAVIWPEGQ